MKPFDPRIQEDIDSTIHYLSRKIQNSGILTKRLQDLDAVHRAGKIFNFKCATPKLSYEKDATMLVTVPNIPAILPLLEFAEEHLGEEFTSSQDSEHSLMRSFSSEHYCIHAYVKESSETCQRIVTGTQTIETTEISCE